MEILQELLAGNTAIGRVEWIGVSGSSRADIQARESVRIVEGGIEGDHHCRPKGSSQRHVTLIQGEHLPAVAAILQRGEINPSLLRRNLIVTGINLAAMKYQVFQIGSAVLRGSGNCPPCERMEENLGPGGDAESRRYHSRCRVRRCCLDWRFGENSGLTRWPGYFSAEFPGDVVFLLRNRLPVAFCCVRIESTVKSLTIRPATS